jgi:quercetin dioxygenase-like cupin family protein
MQRWDLLSIEAPGGTRTPTVLQSSDDSRAVLITLDPGQSLGDHSVKEHAWVLVAEGDVVIEVDGHVEDARGGTLFRFEPNERHSVRSDAGARLLLLLAPWPGEGHYRGEPR